METKSFALGEVKAVGDKKGTFEAVVSVFGNVDSYGDRMVKGAFSRTLAEKGMPPIVWSHEWQVPPIGSVESATETDEGLLIKGRLFTAPDDDHAVARQVYTAMKAGALKEFSFGYRTVESKDITEEGKSVREIHDVDLFEVGPTLMGANDQTRLVGVKAMERVVADEIKTSAAPAAKEQEPSDSGSANGDTPEEPDPRIGALLAAHPNMTIPKETD